MRVAFWAVHQKTAELGGMLRSGLEDTFSCRAANAPPATAC